LIRRGVGPAASQIDLASARLEFSERRREEPDMTEANRSPSCRWSRRTSLAVLAIACATLGAGCSTATGAGVNEWSRDYAAPYERVFEAALDSLESIEFYLETVDEKKGRIRARSSARRADLEATLLVDVRSRGDRVRVDVMAQSAGLVDGRSPARVSGLVRDFLAALDGRLEGRID
jgi:hypothetical protein